MNAISQPSRDPAIQERRLRVTAALNRILVPTDFSEPSLRSIDLALSLLTGSSKPQLCIVHVMQAVQAIAIMEYEPVPAVAIDTAFDLVEKQMRKLRRRYGKGIKLATEVIVGSPVHSICELVDEGAFDLIVMSSHGRSGLSRVFLGSVAEGVVHNARCSVLIAKGFPTPGPDSGSPVPSTFANILVGYDHRAGAHAALDVAEKIAERNDARLTLVHALPAAGGYLPTDVLRCTEGDTADTIMAGERLRQILSHSPEHRPRSVKIGQDRTRSDAVIRGRSYPIKHGSLEPTWSSWDPMSTTTGCSISSGRRLKGWSESVHAPC